MARVVARSAQTGFTLIEAMVALAVVALVSAGSFTAIQGFADQQYRVQTRLERGTVAWNRLLLEYQSSRGWLPPGSAAPQMTGATGRWDWQKDAEPTLTGFLVRHRVEVHSNSASGGGSALTLYLPAER